MGIHDELDHRLEDAVDTADRPAVELRPLVSTAPTRETVTFKLPRVLTA